MSDAERLNMHEEVMRGIAEALCDAVKELLGADGGFTLLTYQHNGEGIASYISTGNKATTLLFLKEAVENLERDMVLGLDIPIAPHKGRVN